MKTRLSGSRTGFCVALTTAFLLSALISNGQYVKAKRGDTVPFDSAVITSLQQYRAESAKFRSGDLLIKSLDSTNRGLWHENRLLDSVSTQLRVALRSSLALVDSKSEAIAKLSQDYDKLLKLAQPTKPTWWGRNKFLIGLALGAGGTAYLLHR